MKIRMTLRFCCTLALLAGLSGMGITFAHAAQDAAPNLDTTKELKEMPVLTGDQWQKLEPDAKITFIWGIGHVVTIEEHVMARHPELRRQGFVAKLAEGLRGVPMDSIIQVVDSYYQKNLDDLELPVMRVIWTQLVKPKLKTGIGDTPLQKQDND